MGGTGDTYALYAHEDDYPDLDAAAACGRLAHALTFRTVSGQERDESQFALLHDHIVRSYPHIVSAGTVEPFGSSLLITVKGSKSDLSPVILIAHQDVVPAGGDAWTHPPFSGCVDDTYIWGRGSLDIKGMLFAELEALESVLAGGQTPERTVYLAFGDDEETESEGASLLASILEKRGVHDAFLLDEGTTTYADGSIFGAKGIRFQGFCLSQKGFLTVRLIAEGHGGHSSNPFGGTSLERIADAIAALRADMPAPRYTPLLSSALGQLGVVTDDDLLVNLAGKQETYPYVSDTMAVTQVEGSADSANILPGNASATINFRLLPSTDMDSFIERIRGALPHGIDLEIVHATPSARTDHAGGTCYDALETSFERFYPSVTFVPLFMCGGCDAIRYEKVTAQSVRVLPYLVSEEDQGRIHATDERISRRSYLQSIRVLRHFLSNVLFS